MAYTVALRFVEFFLMSVLHHLSYHATPAPHIKYRLPMLVPHFLYVHTATHTQTHMWKTKTNAKSVSAGERLNI